MSYLIMFDLPKGNATMGVKINRLLKSIDAERVQDSVWRSENLKELTKIAIWVRNVEGKATILEEKVVY